MTAVRSPARRSAVPARRYTARIAVLGLLGLTACARLAPYHPPPAPGVQNYVRAAARAPRPEPGVPAQVFAYGAAPPARWWQLFRSPVLDAALEHALAANPSLRQAKAALAVARANARAVEGGFDPQVTGTLQAARERISASTLGNGGGSKTFSVYSGGVTVTYSPDLFGLYRLVASGEQAQVDYARYQQDAAYLALEGNVVETLLQIASLESQIRATRIILLDERRLLALLHSQYRIGAVTSVTVLTQTGQLATTEASLVALQNQRTAARHALAALMGAYPEQTALPTLALRDIHLPLTLPVSLPSALLRARPDLRGDEALLRAANAAVGEAIVRMYPNLNLTGSFGGASDVPGDLFLPVNRVWSIIAGVTAPLFDGGTLEARKQAQVAAYQGAIAAYQTAVLSAFEQVANALRALEYDRRILALERRALKASGKALVLARQQYRDGAVQYLTVLTAEIANSDARIAYERARAQRYLDTSALLVATGGGGSARALATKPSLSSTASAPVRTPSP